MNDQNKEQNSATPDVKEIVRSAIQEFIRSEQARVEPAYKNELLDERRRREQLESRVNELIEENRRSRMVAEELERASVVRNELQRLGVTKVDLAFKVVKDDIQRAEDGRLVARSHEGEKPVREYLNQFVLENPEFLPARIPGGSGLGPAHRPVQTVPNSKGVDIDKIKPGMSPEDLERVRQEIARVATESVRN